MKRDILLGIILVCLSFFLGQLNAINNVNLVEINEQTNTYAIGFNGQRHIYQE